MHLGWVKMIRRFFIWRARRQMGKPRYKIDHRAYRGAFNAGFFTFLNRSKFWSSDDDLFYRKRRRRLWAAYAGGIALLVFLIWIIYESVGALGIF